MGLNSNVVSKPFADIVKRERRADLNFESLRQCDQPRWQANFERKQLQPALLWQLHGDLRRHQSNIYLLQGSLSVIEWQSWIRGLGH